MEKKKLVVGVISCSSMARKHMQGVLAYPDAELAAVCDIDEAKIEETLTKLNEDREVPADPTRYTDYKELLKHPGLNTVIIVTPDQLHREMAEAALAAGMHVLCEKPLALTREDMLAIVKAAKNAKTKFMVGQIARYTPSFLKVKEIIDSGEIGELYFVESEYAHDYLHIMSQGGWRSDPIRNGVVGGGCHAVDLLRWIVGDPTEVMAYGTHKLLPMVDYDDATIAIMRFPNNVIGKVFVSTGCKRNYTMRSVFYGTKGTIICDNKSEFFQLFLMDENDHKAETVPQEIPVEVANHNAVGEFQHFADAVLSDTDVPTDAVAGAKTIAVCMAIVESTKTHAPVKPNYDFTV
ncbi:MAG: Gfo/Idh/MocA family oxidoreductase [Oscillospiraceae bacterium]|nr:Gfo/Idh/MocA family oxidoreductase [Oscillospiraceae bacterium]